MQKMVGEFIGRIVLGVYIVVVTPVAFVYGAYCALKGKSEDEFRTNMHRVFGIK